MILFTTILLFLAGCAKDEVTPVLEQKPTEEIASEEKVAEKTSDVESKASESEKPEIVKEEQEKTAETTEEEVKVEGSNTQNTKEQTTTSSKGPQAKESGSTASSSSKTESTEKRQVETPAKAETNTDKKTSTQTTQNDSKKPTEPVKEQTTSTTPVKEEPKKEEPKKQEPKPTVTISVVGDSEKGTILSATQVEMSEGNTVLDVTLKVLKSKGIPISVTGGGSSAYVQGIGNLFEFDRGPTSGWTVKQNGATLSRSTGVTKVSNGDKIQWIYTTNYKED